METSIEPSLQDYDDLGRRREDDAVDDQSTSTLDIISFVNFKYLFLYYMLQFVHICILYPYSILLKLICVKII